MIEIERSRFSVSQFLLLIIIIYEAINDIYYGRSRLKINNSFYNSSIKIFNINSLWFPDLF
jgi:hypothetical protein